MELIAQENGIDLFADSLPSLDEIKKLTQFVNLSEKNRVNFQEQFEANLENKTQSGNLANGIAAYILGSYKLAIEKLSRSKDSVTKSLYLAHAYKAALKYSLAISCMDEAVKLGADKISVSIEKISVFTMAKDFEKAQKIVDKFATLENSNSDYLCNKASLLEYQGLYSDAVKTYDKALEVDPQNTKAMFKLAFMCSMQDDDESAMELYKKAVSTAPANVNALLNLSVLYLEGGKYEQAGECIDKILTHYPNNKRALLFKKDIESSKDMFYDEEKEKRKDKRAQILETPITDFELSVRSRNCFKKMGIRTLEDLLKISEAELLSYKNFGETSLREIKIILESKGLQLGLALQQSDQMPIELPDEAESPEDQGLLNKPIDDLRLSVRARKCLQRLNVRTIGELTRKTEAEMLACKNFGVTSLNEIKKSIGNIGLSLRTLD